MTGSRRRTLRLASTVLATVTAVLGAPGIASAAWPSTSGQITPLVDCVERDSDWSFTAVLGYSSTYRGVVTIPIGEDNSLLLAREGAQPTTFRPGTHHGAASVPISLFGALWRVDGNSVWIDPWRAPACPAETSMPVEGNGAGAALVLVAAAGVGVLVVRRLRRRAAAGRGDGDVPEAAGDPESAPSLEDEHA